jgi:hypothetical protein
MDTPLISPTLSFGTEAAATSCDQCGGLFKPRSGSGGKPQRFCSRECRTAFHSEGQRPQRGPTSDAQTVAPRVAAPEPPKPALTDDWRDFDWRDDDSIILRAQNAIAIYINGQGALVIRRQQDWPNEDEDTIIVISPDNIMPFVDRLTDIVGIPSVGGPESNRMA